MEIERLMQVPVFEGINKLNLQQFIETTPNALHKYRLKQYIVNQGDPCRSIYILSEGRIRTSMINNEGKEITIEDILAPNILAPAFIYSSSNLFPVNVQALANCEIWILNKSYFLKWMQQEPIILSNFLRIISDRSIFLSKKVNTFALQNLKSRLAEYLLNRNHQESQQQIANLLGVARPSLARILSELIEEGCIKIEKRNIYIVNKMKLQQYII